MVSDTLLKRGMFDFKTNRLGITVYKWKDNRTVYLTSNFHSIEDSVLRSQNDDSKLQVTYPSIIRNYNKGIDYNIYRGGC